MQLDNDCFSQNTTHIDNIISYLILFESPTDKFWMIKNRDQSEYQLDVAIRIDLFGNDNIGDNTNISIFF